MGEILAFPMGMLVLVQFIGTATRDVPNQTTQCHKCPNKCSMCALYHPCIVQPLPGRRNSILSSNGGILAVGAHCTLLHATFRLCQTRPLETPLELGDTNWTKGDLEGDLPGSCGSGKGPGAFGGELDCVLSGDGGQSGGESELGMAKEMDSILHCGFTTLNPSW